MASGPYLALKLISECGDDLSAWPSAKHFTSWLCLAPATRSPAARCCHPGRGAPAAGQPRFCVWPRTTIGRTDTALGAFYRRLSTRTGKAKAVTATARKIAVLFYNAVRHGMDYVDPGASSYEARYRARVPSRPNPACANSRRSPRMRFGALVAGREYASTGDDAVAYR